MKIFFEFILYVYLNYIKEEWKCYNLVGRMIIYPLWIIQSILYWIISPIFIPEFLIKRSKFYKKIQFDWNKKLKKLNYGK